MYSMAKLVDLVDNILTDKNTTHSYMDLYETLFSSKKESATAVLEVGIQHGGSIKLWRDYFTNAKVYGIDIEQMHPMLPPALCVDPNVVLNYTTNAYDPVVVKEKFVDTGVKFDIVLDDGCHSYVGMTKFIELYLPLVKDDGILVVEDVPSMERVEELRSIVPEQYKKCIQVFDLRACKGRFDDIVFVVDKSAC